MMAAVFLGGAALDASVTFAAQLPRFAAGAAVLTPTGDLVAAAEETAAESLGATHISLHTASPGTDGANEIADSRTAVTMTFATGALRVASETLGATAITGTATHYGVWAVS